MNSELDARPLVELARRWVIEHYPYNRDHLVRAFEWVLRLDPEASDAVQLAALTHDMERAFPSPEQPLHTRLNDVVYERLHSERSAQIVSEWLRQQAAEEPLIAEVDRLIRAHEVGGWPDADFVQAVDSLSFLETNIGLFLEFVRNGRFTVDEVQDKFIRSYERIRQPHLRAIAAPLLDAALANLNDLQCELAPRPQSGLGGRAVGGL